MIELLAYARTSWVLFCWLISLAFVMASSGCAGPSTPLGAIWALQPQPDLSLALTGRADPESPEAAAPDSSAPATPSGPTLAGRFLASLRVGEPTPVLRFEPPNQVLHGPRPLRVVIQDPHGIEEGYELKVRYHG